MTTLSLGTISLAIIEILLLGATGYCLYKFRAIDDAGIDILAKLVINIFLPCFIANQFLSNFSFGEYPNWWIWPLLGIAIFVVGLIISCILSLLFKLDFKNEVATLIAFQNSGYIPLIMVTTLFEGKVSETLYLNIFLMLIGFNALMWTLGVSMVIGKEAKKFDLKAIINPPFMTMLICLFLAATGANRFIPIVFLKPFKMLGACVLPVAMLVIGGNLGRIALTKIKKEIVWVVIGKLLLMPALALFLVMWLKPSFYISFILMIEAAAPSAITPSIIARHYKTDEKILNQGILYTHTLCMITMPIFLYAYSQLAGI